MNDIYGFSADPLALDEELPVSADDEEDELGGELGSLGMLPEPLMLPLAPGAVLLLLLGSLGVRGLVPGVPVAPVPPL